MESQIQQLVTCPHGRRGNSSAQPCPILSLILITNGGILALIDKIKATTELWNRYPCIGIIEIIIDSDEGDNKTHYTCSPAFLSWNFLFYFILFFYLKKQSYTVLEGKTGI